MTANELEKLYLDAYKKITADVPEGAPSAIDVNAALGLDARFILGCILHHIRETRRDMKKHQHLIEEGLSEAEEACYRPQYEKMALMALDTFNEQIKGTGFTILFDEKV